MFLNNSFINLTLEIKPKLITFLYSGKVAPSCGVLHEIIQAPSVIT